MEITLAKGGRIPPTAPRPAAGAKLACFVPTSSFLAAGATGRWAAAPLRWGKGLQIRRCGPTGGLANSGAGDLYVCIEEQGLSALELLSEMQPPAHLLERMEELKGNTADVVSMAKAGQPDKMGCCEGPTKSQSSATPAAPPPVCHRFLTNRPSSASACGPTRRRRP
ncbi:unnamed protein product [Urochloa humidicola]